MAAFSFLARVESVRDFIILLIRFVALECYADGFLISVGHRRLSAAPTRRAFANSDPVVARVKTRNPGNVSFVRSGTVS